MEKKIREIKNTGYYSKCTGSISKGCRMCVKGRKLVLFITGICSRKCYYCPLSEEKKNKDVVFANERPVYSPKDVLEEAEISQAKGASITGGDPLAVIDRTEKYIRILKEKCGKNFHIHLYAPLELVTEKNLQQLYSAGLDEIRFHPELSGTKTWEKLSLANKFKWDVGIEIPAIPGLEKEIKALLEFAKGKIKFVNINELEISDTNASKLVDKGFVPKDRISYGVLGSERMGLSLLSYCKKMPYSSHYCTAKLKDAVQLRNRIKIRAEKSAEKFDYVTGEGLLIRGAIYLPFLKPSFSYKRVIKDIRKKTRDSAIKKLFLIRKKLISEYRIPSALIKVDTRKIRIVGSLAVISEISAEVKKMNLIPASVTQYPTFDQMETEVDFL